MAEGYRERFDRILKERELYAVKTWDGAKGWGGIWDRMSPYNRSCTIAGAAIFTVWFFAVFVFGFYAIITG